MLALVKKPHIEISLHGEKATEVLAWLRKKYEVAVLSQDEKEATIPIEETTFWQDMQNNRIGNLLAAARIKAGLTQNQLAKKLKLRQNMISDFERGRRKVSLAMAKRFSRELNLNDKVLTS